MSSITVTIDGKKYNATKGQTILDVATANGIDIPTLCHQKELKPFTACFLCVVEVKGARTLLPSCGTVVNEGMEITTMSDRIRSTRKMCLELLLSDHLGDCMAPCQAACPAGCDIPGFIHLLLNNKKREAIALIKDTIPLPASLGRVCPHPCEDNCRRARLEDPVSVCFLKRYVSDEDLSSDKMYMPAVKPDTGKKVAIIGGGPAGLSAAFYLRREGHKPVIFDANIKPGGMLRYGIPAYRLPRNILDKEIGLLAKMGIEIKSNVKLGKDFTLDALVKQGFDATFIAVGAQIASGMGVEGEEEGGVLAGIQFLDEASKECCTEVGEKVVVVGGGNTAIDAARTSLRLGAKEVIILYRRTRKEMPASNIEITEAEREGVKIQYLTAPTRLERTNDGIILTVIRMELGEPDASGRRRPVPIPGSEFKVEASSIISAIGQKVDTSTLKDLRLTKWGTLDVNPDTFETSKKGIFAGGDCITGADIAIQAIAAGRKAAISIDQFLKGNPVTGESKKFNSSMGEVKEAPEGLFEKAKKEAPIPRSKMPEIPIEERVQGFLEVETGFSYDEALKEAHRCLTCGCNVAEKCKVRELAVEYGVVSERFKGARRNFYIDDSNPTFQYESHKCILCGSCIRVCGEEVKNLHCLGFVKRGFETEMRPPFHFKILETKCDTCLKCVNMCPTGALSLKDVSERWKDK